MRKRTLRGSKEDQGGKRLFLLPGWTLQGNKEREAELYLSTGQAGSVRRKQEMSRKNKGTVFAVILGIGIIVCVMASGGVHAEKADEARMEREYGNDIEDTDSVVSTIGHSTCGSGDILGTEVTINGETTDSWLDSVLTRLDALDAAEEAGEEVYTDSEIKEEEDDNIRMNSSDSTGSYLVEADGDEQIDIWDLGLNKWGISYEDTNRALRLITYEGYGYSELSYYVACCCWVRATEGYWGYGNLYNAFGEIDPQYGLWMDELGIADYAYEYLRECYEEPTYCRYCNGLMVPDEWIYAEDGIYCWN